MRYEEQVIDDVTYHLRSGYAVESAPQSAQFLWPEHAALVVKVALTPATIDVKHIFARAFVVLEPKEYPAMREFYLKIASSDEQYLVLAPTGSGN
jgi:hypothetical protein